MSETGTLVNYTQIARLVVQEGLAETMSRQRVYYLRHHDPDFPDNVDKIGRMQVFDWTEIKRYFAEHDRNHRRKGWKRKARDAETGTPSG